MGTKHLALAIDLSDNNDPLDVDAYWEAGYRLLITKATQATSYTWKAATLLATKFHAKGGLQGWYSFLEDMSGTAQADSFWKAIKPFTRNGDYLIVDAEAKGVSRKIVNEFIDRVNHLASADGIHFRGLIYGSPGFLIPAKITMHGGWGLFQAEYGRTAVRVPGFPRGWDLWQNTDHAHVTGVGGTVDRSILKPRVLQPTLHLGDKNFAVLDLASALHQAGYRGFRMNTKYGRGKRRAVNALKNKHHWHADGVAGLRVYHAVGL